MKTLASYKYNIYTIMFYVKYYNNNKGYYRVILTGGPLHLHLSTITPTSPKSRLCLPIKEKIQRQNDFVLFLKYFLHIH